MIITRRLPGNKGWFIVGYSWVGPSVSAGASEYISYYIYNYYNLDVDDQGMRMLVMSKFA
jgi:hypothetical protein